MMNIRILCVGKIKDSFRKEEINEYVKRLSRYCKISIFEVDDCKLKDNASPKEEEMVLKEEGNKLLKLINKDDYVLLMDLHGKEIDSIKFSTLIDQISLTHSTIDVVIGGSLGLSDELRKRANYLLCLSKMTLTHMMTRAIILEQIYRAFKILKNETYHK